MNENVRTALCGIIAEYGISVCEDPKRCEDLLLDMCVYNKEEIKCLLLVLHDGVINELLSSPGDTSKPILLARLAEQIHDNNAIVLEFALWAVESWALALGVVGQSDIQCDKAPIVQETQSPASPLLQKSDISDSSSSDIKQMLNPKDNAEMLWIPKGEFLMGADGFNKDEKPRRLVYLDSYWMYKYEVTVAQYRRYCAESGKQMPAPPSWGWVDDHPVVNVSWQDAADYAKWAEASLPTEAQWEKAACGNDGRKFPWGNDWDASKCNEYSRGPKKTQPVGSYPAGASPYGCMDMAGNVREWCADWYGENYYKSAPSRNPAGPSGGEYRVLRGGGWYGDYETILRCAYRLNFSPNYGDNSHGFRLVR